jgi:gamma-glutamyltranspeptidase/glutathione hydrolase
MRTHRTFLVLALILASSLTAGDRDEGGMFATRSVVHARNGMVAAAHPLAVQIGLDVLKDGGTAVDAAIAVNAALGFLEPVACGIGGDLFALVWDSETEKLYGLNASGRSPLALTADLIPPQPDGTIPVYSPYAWSVPGAVDGWFELHHRFGKLPMTRILAPAIQAAEDGEPVPQVIAAAWARSARVFGEMPGFAQTFLPNGQAPGTGEIFRNPGLARSYRLLAEKGRDAFYKGEIARAVVEFSQRHGGFFSIKDFASHSSEWVEPLSADYRGATLWELPPNGQGIAALEMVNILGNFDLAAMGRDSAEFWHTLVEAKKLAYEDRARYYADPAFSDVPVKELISERYGRIQAERLGDRAARTLDAGEPALSRGDTTYFAVADRFGNMVSLIQSNYTGFGSGYVVEGYGFGLQDRGALFNLKPGTANYMEPGKRPFHTIIPAFITRGGKPWIAFGVMGGDMQPQGHVQVLVNLVDFGMNLQEAGDAPRFYHTGSSEPTGTMMTTGGLLSLESGVPDTVRRDLVKKGHRLVHTLGRYGGYQAVARDPVSGVLSGASESRKDGHAAGY